MALLPFRKSDAPAPGGPDIRAMLAGYSIEVMPRTAAKVEDFRALLPAGTRVYIAHIAGTAIADMLATARRLIGEGFEVMPHFPARLISSREELAGWIQGYAALGVRQALVLGGSPRQPRGAFDNALQLLETGLFERFGFERIHVAGHPEGNRDIDPEGGDALALDFLRRKQGWARERGIEMAIVTQFVFEADPVFDWLARLQAAGIALPVHLGIAGPARLQTLIKFAIACGVGPSLRVLQKRAMDVGKLVLPYAPTDLVAELSSGLQGAGLTDASGRPGIAQLHIFPLGGIAKAAEWAIVHGGDQTRPAAIA